jgi:hypothetical protein
MNTALSLSAKSISVTATLSPTALNGLVGATGAVVYPHATTPTSSPRVDAGECPRLVSGQVVRAVLGRIRRPLGRMQSLR